MLFKKIEECVKFAFAEMSIDIESVSISSIEITKPKFELTRVDIEFFNADNRTDCCQVREAENEMQLWRYEETDNFDDERDRKLVLMHSNFL
jgi:hypothetical protein